MQTREKTRHRGIYSFADRPYKSSLTTIHELSAGRFTAGHVIPSYLSNENASYFFLYLFCCFSAYWYRVRLSSS